MATVSEIVEELRRDNPSASEVDLFVYADALAVYAEASRNIRRHGAVVAHPRTGSPVKNPYLDIQTNKGAALSKMRYLKTDRVAAMLQEETGDE